MKKRPQSRRDVPWSKRQEIPDPQILDAADQYEATRSLLAEQPPPIHLQHHLAHPGGDRQLEPGLPSRSR